MAKIELKQPVVEEIKENIKDAKSVVLVDYRGLTVDQDTQLRKSMREADVIYKVYKNTMVKLAIAGTEFESLKDELEGPTAVVISKTDATAPARLAANFAKANPALNAIYIVLLLASVIITCVLANRYSINVPAWVAVTIPAVYIVVYFIVNAITNSLAASKSR